MTNNMMDRYPAKCGIMIIKANSEGTELHHVLYNNEIIPNVDSYVYLGINFNDLLDFRLMANHRFQKCIEK